MVQRTVRFPGRYFEEEKRKINIINMKEKQKTKNTAGKQNEQRKITFKMKRRGTNFNKTTDKSFCFFF